MPKTLATATVDNRCCRRSPGHHEGNANVLGLTLAQTLAGGGGPGWGRAAVRVTIIWGVVERDAQPDFHVPAGDLDVFDEQPQ
jgi:hypothetical protein